MLTANDDGTITFAGRTFDGPQVADLVSALLGAMSQATEIAGQMDDAKSAGRAVGTFHAVVPNMVQMRKPHGHPDPVLVLIFGNAHLGVILPESILRDLSRGILTGLPPDPMAN